jgi:hypothetical protein
LLTTAIEALTPAVPLLIARLQNADKISHAGSIPVFGLNRNRSIGRGLAPLPNPEKEISDVFHGVLSAANWAAHISYWSGNAPLNQEKAGGRYAADLILQLPARGSGSVALHSSLISSTGCVIDAIARGYEMTALR